MRFSEFKNRLFGVKRGVYGLIITLVSLAAFVGILSVKSSVLADYERLKIENGCFQEEAGDSWNNLTPRERKEKMAVCMAASNRAAQVKYAPFVFIGGFVVGLLLLASVFINIKSNADKVLEEWEKDDR